MKTRPVLTVMTVLAAGATAFAIFQVARPSPALDVGPSAAPAAPPRTGTAEVSFTTDPAHAATCITASAAVALERLRAGSAENGPDPRQEAVCGTGSGPSRLVLDATLAEDVQCVARLEGPHSDEARSTGPDAITACSAAAMDLASRARRGW